MIEYFEGPVTALEHVAFRAASAEALEDLRHRLQKAGVAVRAENPSLAFRAPSGLKVHAVTNSKFFPALTIHKRPIRELEFGCDESSISI